MEYPEIKGLWFRDHTGRVCKGIYSSSELEMLSPLETWRGTEKVAGLHVKGAWNGTDLYFTGKRAALPDVGGVQQAVTGLSHQVRVFEKLFRKRLAMVYMVAYGVGCGPLTYGLVGTRLALFDVLCDGLWLRWGAILAVAEALGIDTVPVIGEGKLEEFSSFVEEGFNSVLARCDMPGVGLVLHPRVELRDRRGERIQAQVTTAAFKQGRPM